MNDVCLCSTRYGIFYLKEKVVVTKDNLVETVIDSGFRSVEDVYANVPEDQWPK